MEKTTVIAQQPSAATTQQVINGFPNMTLGEKMGPKVIFI